MKLHRALGISAGDVVAFVGAGGKSSAISAVAGELADAGMKVLVAPTTKMMLREAEGIGPVVTSDGSADGLRPRTEEALAGSRSAAVVVGGELLSKNRVGGVAPAEIPSLASLVDVVLAEADGARHRPIKGTADHEPLMPEATTLVVAVGNIQAFGTPVDEEHVHRPEAFSALTGIGPGQSITARAFALALAQGSLGKTPPGARTAALITGVQPGRTMSDASIIARELWRLGVENVVLTSLPNESPGQAWIP